jgi:hypothetical protein
MSVRSEVTGTVHVQNHRFSYTVFNISVSRSRIMYRVRVVVSCTQGDSELGEKIVSDIARKNYVNKRLFLNGYRDGAV